MKCSVKITVYSNMTTQPTQICLLLHHISHPLLTEVNVSRFFKQYLDQFTLKEIILTKCNQRTYL